MKKIYILAHLFLCIGIKVTLAQVNVLHNFNDTLGEYPYGTLTFSGSRFYGMTERGEIYDSGCIFSMDTNGNGYIDLFDFNGTNGRQPTGSLILSGKFLYGMAGFGGANKLGCIFSIDTDGNRYSDMLDFNGTNGAYPVRSLIISGSRLFGMTSHGGAIDDSGCIFSVDTDGSGYKKLHDFNGTNGAFPYGDLILLGNVLFGLTPAGGVYGGGVIFSIDTDGSDYRELYNFTNTSGAYPYGTLTYSRNKFFGMTWGGGITNAGCVFSIDTNGNGYQDLFNFDVSDGENPYGSLLILGSKLYGMTEIGGNMVFNAGCIFSIDTNGNGFKDMLDFNVSDGEKPFGDLTYLGNALYGMTAVGGMYGGGVILKIDSNSVSSINNIKASKEMVSLYPNPNNGIFTILLSHPELVSGSQAMEIYNVLGEQVYYGMLKQVQYDYEINIRSQPNGIYFYRVLTESGNLIGEGKLIVEH